MRKAPNVVFVLTDDQGYGDLSCTGSPLLRTPLIDSFHQDSVRLTDFHVGPTCAPTRAGLLTGHYANSTGVWHTIGGRSLLRKDEVTLADVFRHNGYRTGIFGKWHLGDNYPYRPQDRGFDEAIVHGGGGISQAPDYWGNDYFDDTYSVNGHRKRFEGYCTDVWFREALAFIDRNKDHPFFCYLPTNAPHSPFNVEPRYKKPYRGEMPDNRASFFGMIANIDENFGRLRNRLDELGLTDNTILVFMTDNGTSTGVTCDDRDFVVDGYNAGLRGKKGSEYDGGHRTPFFMRWPAGGLKGGRDIDELTANVDIMPTLMDLCGLTWNGDISCHGASIAALLRGEIADWPDRVLVTDSQRLTDPVKWRKSAVMTGRWRLVNGRELFDMIEDRGQRNDVASEHPAVVSELCQEYEKWWEIVSEQFAGDIPISIGGPTDGSACLCAHDWRNEDSDCPWNQGMIRQGYASQGYWEVLIERPGLYSFELRRWPAENGRCLAEGIDGDDITWRKECVPEEFASWYTGGAALELKEAVIRIQGQEMTKKVNPDSEGITFEIELSKESTRLQAFFTHSEGKKIGPYYVYVRRLTPAPGGQ